MGIERDAAQAPAMSVAMQTTINRWIAAGLSLITPGLGLHYAGRTGAAIWAAIAAVAISQALGIAVLFVVAEMGAVDARFAGPGFGVVLHLLVAAPFAGWIFFAAPCWPRAPAFTPRNGALVIGFLIAPIAASCVAATIVRAQIGEVYRVASVSMAPTLSADTLMFGKTGAVRGVIPPQGAVIAFRLPSAPRTVLIKRVIARPGDTIALDAGVIILNGVAIERRNKGDMLFEETLPNGVRYRTRDEGRGSRFDSMAPIIIPDGEVFVLGDNRDRSEDSRSYRVGLVPKALILSQIQVARP